MVKRILKVLGWIFLVALLSFLLVKGFLFGPKLDIEPVADGVSFDFPVHLSFLPLGPDGKEQRLIVSEKAGKVRWVLNQDNALPETILDITDRVYSGGHEEGLLSAVFDPTFPARPYLYVFYSVDNPKRSRISRFTVDESLHGDPQSELKILEVEKFQDGHNGGQLSFDHHGFLLSSIGDSDASPKIGNKMQERQTLLGTIIRIDVRRASVDQPYLIPDGNPFKDAKDGSLPEIWAYGLRNPWRYSLEEGSDLLVVADVGADAREEISVVEKGGNYGWPTMEGELCRTEEFGSCKNPAFKLPIGAFSHDISRAITGAAFYRGKEVGALAGRVVFADYMRGVFSFEPSASGIVQNARTDIFKWPTTFGPNAGRTILIASLSVGPDKEIYIVNGEGNLGRLRDITLWKRIRGTLFAMLLFK